MPKQDDFRTRSEQDNPFAEAFIFEAPGTLLVGHITGYSTGYDPTYRQGEYPVVIIKEEDTGQEFSVHCFYDSLISQFRKEKPPVGSRVSIRYRGEKKNREGTFSYKQFVLLVDRPKDYVPDFSVFETQED